MPNYVRLDLRADRTYTYRTLAGVRKRYPFLESASDERFAKASPDGRWVAYTASESDRLEVSVASFPGPGGKQQVSIAGGSYPRWWSDGKELFYHSLDNKLMAATVRVDAARVEVDAVQPLFERRAPDGLPRNFDDVASNGQRFMIAFRDDTASSPLTLVSNGPRW